MLELTTTPWAEKTRLDSCIDDSTHGGDVVTASGSATLSPREDDEKRKSRYCVSIILRAVRTNKSKVWIVTFSTAMAFWIIDRWGRRFDRTGFVPRPEKASECSKMLTTRLLLQAQDV